MKDVAASVFISTLSCAVSLSVKFFPAYPAERCALNGKVRVMLTTVCSIKSVLSRDSPRERTYLGDICWKMSCSTCFHICVQNNYLRK